MVHRSASVACRNVGQHAAIDVSIEVLHFSAMTVLEIKHEISRLKGRDLREVHSHVVRVRHSTPEWRKSMARKLRAVQAGKFVTAEELEARIARE